VFTVDGLAGVFDKEHYRQDADVNWEVPEMNKTKEPNYVDGDIWYFGCKIKCANTPSLIPNGFVCNIEKNGNYRSFLSIKNDDEIVGIKISFDSNI